MIAPHNDNTSCEQRSLSVNVLDLLPGAGKSRTQLQEIEMIYYQPSLLGLPLSVAETLQTEATRRLVDALRMAGGSMVSLYKLSLDAGVDYPHAYERIMRLESSGIVHVEKFGPGRPMKIQLCQ